MIKIKYEAAVKVKMWTWKMIFKKIKSAHVLTVMLIPEC